MVNVLLLQKYLADEKKKHIKASELKVMLTVKTAQESAEWPPPWRRSSTGPLEPLQ